MSCESKDCYRPASHRVKKGASITHSCKDHLPKTKSSASIEELSEESIEKVNRYQIKKSLKNCRKIINDTYQKICKQLEKSKINILKQLEETNEGLKFMNFFIPVILNKDVYQEIKNLIKNKLFVCDRSINKKFFENDEGKFMVRPELFSGILSLQCKERVKSNSFYFPMEFKKMFKIFNENESSHRRVFIGMEDHEEGGPRFGIEIFADGSIYQGRIVNLGSPSKRKYQGLKIYSNGDVYKGDFSQGERSGLGKFLPFDEKQLSYKGSWFNDLKDGEGIETDTKNNEFKVIYAKGDCFHKNHVIPTLIQEPNAEMKLSRRTSIEKLPEIKSIRRSGSLENLHPKWKY